MKTIEEVMSEVNSVFGLKKNQNLTHEEKMQLLQQLIESDRNESYARGYFNGKQDLKKKIEAML